MGNEVNAALIERYLAEHPADAVAEAARLAVSNGYRRSLYLTAKTLLGYKDINRDTHGGIISALESPRARKLICVPRGCLKSTIACVAYPIWLLLRNPNLRILIDSELYTNSKNFLREIKAQLETPRMTSVFGTFKSDTNWNEGKITIRQRTIVKKEASITVGGVGTTKVGQHYDVIIGDDYNSNKNSLTPEGCEKVINHYRYNQSILEPDGTYVVIGTRYSENDLIGFILKNEIGDSK
jgi:hypothetical protein